jgi:hypothetical protein
MANFTATIPTGSASKNNWRRAVVALVPLPWPMGKGLPSSAAQVAPPRPPLTPWNRWASGQCAPYTYHVALVMHTLELYSSKVPCYRGATVGVDCDRS